MISLSPLDRVQIAKMVSELAAHHALPKDIVEGVSERTGGVPLFVEEVTRLLLERGEQGGAQAIPPTLQQSLAARLDRLGSARETAQIGAVLGRGFSYALLQSVAGLDEGALRSALERLAEADILFVEGDGAQANYRFKHALIQDAAYDSLLKSRRQALHAPAAEILRDSASPEPEAIAHHFTQAGLDDLAIEWWGKAGDQALRRSAFQEAIAHLGKAIAMADKAAGGAAWLRAVSRPATTIAGRLRQRADRRARLRRAETTEAFAKARESTAGGKAAALSVCRLTTVCGVAATLAASCWRCGTHVETFLADVEERCATRPKPESRTARPGSRIGSPENTAKRAIIWNARSPCSSRAATTIWRSASDMTSASGRCFPSRSSCGPSAILARALSLVDAAEARLAGLAHVGTRAYGTMHSAIFEMMRGDLSRAAPNITELARLAREHDLPVWRAVRFFSRAGRRSESRRPPTDSRPCVAALALLREQNVLRLRRAHQDWASERPKPALAMSTAPSPSSTRRWRRANGSVIAHSRRSFIAFAATCCSSATRQTPRPPKTRSSTLSKLQVDRGLAASRCARRFRLPSSTTRSVAPSKPTPSSRRRSTASLRRRKCRKSPKRRRC